MIKVLLVTNILGRGGAERTVQTIAMHADARDFSISVLCLEGGGDRAEALIKAGVHVLVGDGTAHGFMRLVRPGEYDIVHFHRSGHAESLHAALYDYLQPAHCMETNVFAFADPVLGPRFDLRIYKSIMMLTERAWKGAMGDPVKQRVIYNPVTIDAFAEYALDSGARAARRARLGIQPADFVIGRVGRNDPVKWGDVLLIALPGLFAKIPNLVCILHTAPDSRRAWLKRRGYFGNRVIVLPETGDERALAETYQLLDLYVHTSRRGEAFGNSLNEAMAWRLPIVVENTPHWDNGQVEQVENNVTGYVVKSAGGLIAAVTHLARDPAKCAQFGAAGKEKVARDFGLSRGIGQYELAYRQLAGIVPPTEIMRRIFPSADDIASYHARYASLRALDYPHRFSLTLALRERYARAYWRARDSLQSRISMRSQP